MDETIAEINAAKAEFQEATREVKGLLRLIAQLPRGEDKEDKEKQLVQWQQREALYEREIIRLKGELREAQASQQGI